MLKEQNRVLWGALGCLLGGACVAALLCGRWTCQADVHKRPSGPGLQPLSTVAARTAAISQADGDALQEAQARPHAAVELPLANLHVEASDRTAAAAARERLNAKDNGVALGAARQLMRSEDAAVRSEVIRRLSRIGLPALPELSDLLLDKGGVVNREALQAWLRTVAACPDDGMKSRILLAGMSIMDKKEALEEIAQSVSGLAKPVALRSFVTLIESANPFAAAVAREHYRLMTGSEFTTADQAETWLSETAQPSKPVLPAEK